MQRRSNGHDSTSPLPVVLADVAPEEIQVVEPGWWARLRAWTDRAKLLHLLGCALGAVVVALVVAGWRARGAADSLARRADVAAAVAAHADQLDPKDVEQDRRLDRFEERQAAMAESMKRLLDHFEIPPPAGL